MTVSTSDNRVQYTGNAVTLAFSFPYLFYADADLMVYLDDALQASGYTVSGAGSGSGGTVTFSIAPGSGVVVTIERIVSTVQETDFENFDGNPADVTEKQFDLCVMMSQQLADSLDRSLKFPATITGITAGILPQPVAGSILVWDGTTGAIGNADIADLSTSINTVLTGLASGDILQWDGSNWVNTQLGISAFGATLVDDSDAAAARATLGLGTAATTEETDYATSAQGAKADTAVQPLTQQVLGYSYTSTSANTSSSASIPHDNTKPQNTEGTELLTLAYTPKIATSKLRIRAILRVSTSAAQYAQAALFKDSAADALSAASVWCGAVGEDSEITVEFWETSGSTSARTYKIRYGQEAADTMYINGTNTGALYNGACISFLEVTEYYA